jgi:hypothetical protein
MILVMMDILVAGLLTWRGEIRGNLLAWKLLLLKRNLLRLGRIRILLA